jgi:predicted transcriptional regulator
MQVILSIDDILARAKEISLPTLDLARAAGVHESTVYRAKGNTTLSTLRALTEALTARELTLRDYLIGLHGLPETGVGCQVSDVSEEEKAA